MWIHGCVDLFRFKKRTILYYNNYITDIKDQITLKERSVNVSGRTFA